MINNKLISYIKRFLGLESLFRVQLEKWLENINVTANKVLDIGGGLKPVKNRVKKWDVKEYKILDNNLQGNFNPDFYIDLNDIIYSDKYGWILKSVCYKKDFNKIIKESFDVIFCLEVMEYIYNPLTVLKFIYHILTPGGILYISFPSIYPIHAPQEYDYLRYTKSAIIRFLKESRFSNWKIDPRTATAGAQDLLNFYKKERMKGVKDKIILDIGYMVKAHK
ncbi:MAG: hypothetical protein KatS3mg092_0418 [Patescibacteria group bacterium]|nr:MAG: hypothetical protein KatS3mg092_0418 [Patescibacteria group bacterium]